LINKKFFWFEIWWPKIQSLMDRRPSALLLLGAKGTAKTEFALEVAAAWLCQSPLADRSACGHCQSCAWMTARQHPDFRWVRPEADEEIAADPSGPRNEDLETSSRAASLRGDPSPVAAQSDEKKSTEIRISQIRALSGFANVGSHRGGLRVVVISPANRMNFEAANALLKTLEEPAESLAFILVSDTLRGLPATVLSRCRRINLEIDAQTLSQRQTEQSEAAQWLLPLLAQGDVDPIRWAEAAGKSPAADALELLMRWMTDTARVHAGLRPRAFPAHEQPLKEQSYRIRSAQAWSQAIAEIQKMRGVAEHPLNPKLFYESIFDRLRRALV
jgi:DNA polymerase III subunit delta'